VCYAWFEEKDGPARSGMTYGQLLHSQADRLIAWAESKGIRIELEDRRCTSKSCGDAGTSGQSAAAPTPGSSPAPSTRTGDPPAAGSAETALFS